MGAHPSKPRKRNRRERQPRREFLPLDPRSDDWPRVWAMRDPSAVPGIEEETHREPVLLPVEIADGLYLGNAGSVNDLRRIHDLGITAVLNAAGPAALRSRTVRWFRRTGIAYRCLDGKDESGYPMLQRHWIESLDFLRRELEEKRGKCVIHCVAGRNRSALLATAYLSITGSVPVLEALARVRKRRGAPVVENPGFQEQLVALARLHGCLGEAPGTSASSIPGVPPAPDD
eukprot:CAMPEP_0197191878 /NCGR_PEP_ID=MMETSP1423-20130617/24179_1 /TAXON_ID=476441 /ORGANISM="Pseudo-nitzschia heimii, Strain UNC1101" /LENGTH=230 /DNA_ID=CAMNT_0042644659 /DNA_START=271 /DNA_END=960 /DNA_ORIENTATION=+